MDAKTSRRDFLSASLLLPTAGFASTALGVRGPEAPVTGQASPPKPALDYRVLGKTGMKVTTVGMGCMITSDASVIERAADLGINYFDTARGYQHGNNERMVGAALKRRRKDIFLSSKSGAGNKAEALKDLDTSLSELGTDHLDIWYLHGKDNPDHVTDDLIEAQQIAKTAGKIRFAGLSTHEPARLVPVLVQKGTFDVVLMTYNFSMEKSRDEAIEQANRAGLGVVAMKVMAGGYRKVKPGDPQWTRLKQGGAMLAALKWVVRNSGIRTTVPSMTDMDQLEENLKAMSEHYTETDQKLLTQQLEHITPLYCRMCPECAGTCAKGLPVKDVLRYLTYADGYGQFALGREKFRELPAELAAVRCADCATCTVQCPAGVQVASRLRRAQELFA